MNGNINFPILIHLFLASICTSFPANDSPIVTKSLIAAYYVSLTSFFSSELKSYWNSISKELCEIGKFNKSKYYAICLDFEILVNIMNNFWYYSEGILESNYWRIILGYKIFNMDLDRTAFCNTPQVHYKKTEIR